MHSLTQLAALLSASSLVAGHHVFVRVAHNGVWQPPLQYIRNRTAPWEEVEIPNHYSTREWQFPTYPLDAPTSVRCGRNSLAWANQTDVLKVKAGDTVDFASTEVSPNMWDKDPTLKFEGCPEGKGICRDNNPDYSGILHEGPAVILISPVPTGQDVHTYDGSGEWIKIASVGLEMRKDASSTWLVWLAPHGKRITATIPKQTPPGQYLMRVDIISPDSPMPQFYPSCAQIEVESEATAELPKGVKIPEDWQATSEGMHFPQTEHGTREEVLKEYNFPGGKLWDGEKMVADKWDGQIIPYD